MKRFAVCLSLLVSCFALVVFALGNGHGLGAVFQGLGDLPGGSNTSQAHALSDDGCVVVGYSDTTNAERAFLWTEGCGMVDLGTLPDATDKSYAKGVSEDGSVVVGHSYGSGGSSHEAFRWTLTDPETCQGTMVGLGDLSGGSPLSAAQDVSSDGSVVVGLGKSAAGSEAFRWTCQEGMVPLGHLPGGTSSIAQGVSDDGSVIVGTAQHSDSAEMAVCWIEPTQMRPLGRLPGKPKSEAYAVSPDATSCDDAIVAGFSGTDSSDRQAVVWTPSEDGNDPDPFAVDPLAGNVPSLAYDVSAGGSVIVGHATWDSYQEACVWTCPPDGPYSDARKIKDVLLEDFGICTWGWRLETALGVSRNGRAIVGYGINPAGEREAWRVLLDPLELNWINESGGEWDDAANWDYCHPATEKTKVYIKPAAGLTVIGPASTTRTETLTLGGETAFGAATLQLQSTGLLSAEEIWIGRRGKLVGGGTLEGTINNSGEIDLAGGNSQLVHGSLRNNGLLHGSGEIGLLLWNRVHDGMVGEVRVEDGDRLLFTHVDDRNLNSSEINLIGGTVEFTGELTNDADGFISGRGQLMVLGGLTNNGVMALSAGTTDVYGDVANDAPDSKIVISGGSTTTFYDDVHSDGEIRVGVDCRAVFFGELSGTGGTHGRGTVYLEGDLRPGDRSASGKVAFGGDLLFGPSALYESDICEWDSDNVPDPWDPPSDPAVNDKIRMDGGRAELAGTLELVPRGKLSPPHPHPQYPWVMVQWYGFQTRTIIDAQGDGWIEGTFESVPEAQPEVWRLPRGRPGDPDYDPGNWEQGHLYCGVFLTRCGNTLADDDPDDVLPDQPGLTYLPDVTRVHLFQAASGDTNGDRLLVSEDIQYILSCNKYLTGNPATWPEGDFNGCDDPDDPTLPPIGRQSIGYCDSYDIQLILSTGLWPPTDPPTPYREPPEDCKPAGGEARLLVVPGEDGALRLRIDTDGLPLSSYAICSADGALTGEDAASLGMFVQDDDFVIAAAALGTLLDGVHDLGAVIGPAVEGVEGLSFTYTVQGAAGLYQGQVVLVPEPGTVLLLLFGGLGILAFIFRKRVL